MRKFQSHFHSVPKSISIHIFGTFWALPAFPSAHSQVPAPAGRPARTESATAQLQSHLQGPLRVLHSHTPGLQWGLSQGCFSVQLPASPTLLIPQKAAASSLNPKFWIMAPAYKNLRSFSCIYLPASYHFLLCNIRPEWLISFSHMPAHT